VETEDAPVTKELPFVVGVLADLAGNDGGPYRPFQDRKFIQINRDNFNDVQARWWAESVGGVRP
jgi:type VI secretion system protein ImpB